MSSDGQQFDLELQGGIGRYHAAGAAFAIAKFGRDDQGLGMLLHQARPAFAAWFGPVPAISETLLHMVRTSL